MNTWRSTSATGRMLLLAVLLTGLTTFMFLPLLALDLTDQGIPTAQAGFLVGLLSFCGQGFSLISGMIVDRFDSRFVLAAGFVLRIAGYLLLGLGLADGTHMGALVAGIAVIGVGGSLLGMSIKTLLVRDDSVPRREMLALRSTFVNVGVIVGPALGALLYPFGFDYILAACVASHLLLGIRLTARPVQAAPPTGSPTVASGGQVPGSGESWARWQWGPLVLVGVAYWAIYSQLNVVLPIAAKELTGSAAATSVVFTLNGALVVLFQYSLLRHVFRKAGTRTLLALGFLAFGGGYALLIAFSGWGALIAFVLPITLAEMLISPSLDEQAVRAGSLRRTGLALGTMSAAGALGSLLGSGLGGYLLGPLHGGGLWLLISCLSLAAAAFCFLLPKGSPQHA
ncbi:MFS transporter [uncultured Streptomyces sp.]|uniref:MFS transporter n=1 Tax=uncultured Streptomyces sp. TaxID=174707 RepID=UPI00260459F1|nr:MFS transporter [uncultured Streptomyces sp.]